MTLVLRVGPEPNPSPLPLRRALRQAQGSLRTAPTREGEPIPPCRRGAGGEVVPSAELAPNCELLRPGQLEGEADRAITVGPGERGEETGGRPAGSGRPPAAPGARRCAGRCGSGIDLVWSFGQLGCASACTRSAIGSAGVSARDQRSSPCSSPITVNRMIPSVRKTRVTSLQLPSGRHTVTVSGSWSRPACFCTCNW